MTGEEGMKSGDTVVNLDIWRGKNKVIHAWTETVQKKKYACYITVDETFSLLIVVTNE